MPSNMGRYATLVEFNLLLKEGDVDMGHHHVLRLCTAHLESMRNAKMRASQLEYIFSKLVDEGGACDSAMFLG